MQERRLRLGDVLDDYCPREKRLSNHVIVALVDDEVRTTRCETCDFEHVYKGGKVPARRKKADPQAVLYKTVLENITGQDTETGTPLSAAAEADVPQAAVVAAAPRLTPAASLAPPVEVRPAAVVAEEIPPADAEPQREESVHRHTLIRATLPKIEGQVQERKPADFMSHARPTPGRRFGAGGSGRPRQPQASGNTGWGGYSPYANGHPSGKGPQQGQGGQPGKSRPNNRRGR